MATRDFNPLEILLQLESELRRSADTSMRSVLFQPRVDMFETIDALVVKMELAGVQPDRLQIVLSADNRTLTVAGERRESQEDRLNRVRCFQLEIYFGEFERVVQLPASVRFRRDDISALYRDGFLIISLPKWSEESTERRMIEVTEG